MTGAASRRPSSSRSLWNEPEGHATFARVKKTAACAAFIWATSVLAHPADMISAAVERDTQGTVRASLSFTPNTLHALVPSAPREGLPEQAILVGAVWDGAPLFAGPHRCALVSSQGTRDDATVTLSASFDCPPGQLKQTFSWLSVLPEGYRVVFTAEDQGRHFQSFAEGTFQTLVVPEDAPADGVEDRGWWKWLVLGAEHIWIGYDHLAFLAALLLVATGWKQLLGIVTSFTVAHSITLALTTLGAVTLSATLARWTEILIAFSIVIVAAANLVWPQKTHRASVTFVFGLVHGLGFASVLESLGLGDSIARALVGFNVGVELGQAAVVLAAFPLILLSRRDPRRGAWVLRWGSAALMVAGGYWMTTRLLG